jgi:hypothetical protein
VRCFLHAFDDCLKNGGFVSPDLCSPFCSVLFQWNHIAVTWQQAGGGVLSVYRNGGLLFRGQNGQVAAIPGGGYAVIGQEQVRTEARPFSPNHFNSQYSSFFPTFVLLPFFLRDLLDEFMFAFLSHSHRTLFWVDLTPSKTSMAGSTR